MTQKDKEIIKNFLNKKEPVIEFFEVQAIVSMMYEICKRFEEKDKNIHINIFGDPRGYGWGGGGGPAMSTNIYEGEENEYRKNILVKTAFIVFSLLMKMRMESIKHIMTVSLNIIALIMKMESAMTINERRIKT